MIYLKLITKNDARLVTAACSSPLCDYMYLQEAEDVLQQRTEKELCEKAEHHCIYTLLSLSTETFFSF